MKRAAGAQGGSTATTPSRRRIRSPSTDADGEPLDGSKHNYTLTFAAGQLPPVNAFWSVTMYDGKTQLLIKNPINRYLINSPMLPEHEEERGRLADALHPEEFAGHGQGIQLAARAGRPDLPGHAPLLAEDRGRPRSCRPEAAHGSPPPVVLAAQTAPATPDIKAISEEAIIYGLPMSMYYSIMNEYAINKDSGQFKAPFNTIANEPRCTRPPTLQSSRPTATRPIRGCS